MNHINNHNPISVRAAVCLIWLAIWWIAAALVNSDLLLPGPVPTAAALFRLAGTGGFWLDIVWTLARVAAGIAVSLLAGAACAVLASRNHAVREFLHLPVSFFKSIPVMAIIIYVILIVQASWVAVVVCFFMCFPIAYTNLLRGITSMDRGLDELGSVLGMSRAQKWSIIERPELQPEIRASVELIAGMSWKVVVASEVLAIPAHSIGYQMLDAKYYLETPELFAYVIVLIILSLAVEKILAFAVDHSYRSAGKRLRGFLTKTAAADGSLTAANDAASTAESAGVTVSLKNVSKNFDSGDGEPKRVLENVNMEFGPGVTALLGPSGEGKTTVARLIMGFEQPDRGTVETGGAKPDVLFQEDRLLPWLSAKENLLLAFINKSARGSAPGNADACGGAGESGFDAAVSDMAEKLELTEDLDKKPAELSGGMAHRAALGRALLGGSPLLILDEPMRGLNRELEERVLKNIADDLRKDAAGNPRTVIMITHDEALAEGIADKIIRI